MKDNNLIVKLKFPENIRLRQGMFGSDGTNADILLREIIDNSVDLVVRDKIPDLKIRAYTNYKNKYHIAYDTGTGIPLYKDKDYPEKDQPIIVDLLSQINVGSNFFKTEYSLGTNGVGSSLTNALSEEFRVYVNINKKDKSEDLPDFIKEGLKVGNTIFKIFFQKGKLIEYDVMTVDQFKFDIDHLECLNNIDSNFGTLVVFKPDASLLESTKANYHGYPFMLINSLFKYDSDFKDVKVDFKINDRDVEPFNFKKFFSLEETFSNKVFSCAFDHKTEERLPLKFIFQFAYSKDDFYNESNGSVNLLKTPQGRHIQIIQTALGHALNRYNNLVNAKDSKLGLKCFVLSFAVNPLWNSQDKTRLSRFEDKGYDEPSLINSLTEYFSKLINENTEYFDLLCERIIEYKRLSNKLSNIEALKSKVIMGSDSDRRRAMSGEMSRVYEATSKEWNKRELFIVEGDSASGNIVKLRNREFQSVLPLRGKLINTSEFDESKLVSNKEVLAIINTIGCGIGALTDSAQSKYGKIIIAVDADDDGSHIANLITGLFLIHAPQIIKDGLLYKLETPFYEWHHDKKVEFFWHDEKDKINFNVGKVIKLKGLGSHDSDSTQKYIVESKHRRLIQIIYNEDNELEIEEASKLLSSTLARRDLMERFGILDSSL